MNVTTIRRNAMRLFLVGTWVLQAEAISFGNWYEASSDKEGVSCAYGDSGPDAAGFYFGANLALSVEGAGKLKPSDVVLTAGTYDAFGTPTILSELEMWREFGQPAQRYFNQKPCVLERDEDGNWANWEAYEDDDDLLYVVSPRIWPEWNPRDGADWSPSDTGRQWILIPLKPADGGPSFRHTFSVSLREDPGVVREISFVKAYDQCIVRFDLDGKGRRIGGGDLVQVVDMDSDDEDDLVPTRATLKARKSRRTPDGDSRGGALPPSRERSRRPTQTKPRSSRPSTSSWRSPQEIQGRVKCPLTLHRGKRPVEVPMQRARRSRSERNLTGGSYSQVGNWTAWKYLKEPTYVTPSCPS